MGWISVHPTLDSGQLTAQEQLTALLTRVYGYDKAAETARITLKNFKDSGARRIRHRFTSQLEVDLHNDDSGQ